MKFQDKLYTTNWHNTLSQFRSNGVLCDVTLVADGQEYPVHKLILAGFSPYFRAMFNYDSSFIESREAKVNLPGIDRNALEQVLNFMYTSHIDINEDNIYPLMDMVNLMQIHSLRFFIHFYLENSLTVTNCIVFYTMANLYQYFDFARKAFNFILLNFSEVILTEEYLNMTFDTIYKIVSSRLLDVDSEDKIVESILKWIDHDIEKRKDHAELLLSKIEIEELSTTFITQLKNNALVPEEMRDDIIECETSRLLCHENGSIRRNRIPLCKRIRHKLERDVVFAIGGESSGKATVSVECFTKGYHRWKSFVPVCVFKKCSDKHTKTVPPLKMGRFQAACTTDGCNKIFVIGGQNTPFLLDQCEVYDIRTNQWEFFKKYPLKVCASGAACVDNKLYVAGGSASAGAIHKAHVMDLTLETQVWKEIPPMSRARYFHGLIALGGYIFAIGGFNQQGIALQSCERYDPGSEQWVKIADLKQGRAKFACAALDEYIYVFGGTTFDCDTLKTVEKYNVLNDEWLPETPMPLPRQCLAATVYENEIFCVGGSNSIYALDCVDKFSLRTKRWHWEESLQVIKDFSMWSQTSDPQFTNKEIKINSKEARKGQRRDLK